MALYRYGYNIEARREMWRKIEAANPRMRTPTRKNIRIWLYAYEDRARVVGPRRGWWDSYLNAMSRDCDLTVKEVRTVLEILERAGVAARERARNGANKGADYRINVKLCDYDTLFSVPSAERQTKGQTLGQRNGQGKGQHEDLKVEDSTGKNEQQQDSDGVVDEEFERKQDALIGVAVSTKQATKRAGKHTLDRVLEVTGFIEACSKLPENPIDDPGAWAVSALDGEWTIPDVPGQIPKVKSKYTPEQKATVDAIRQHWRQNRDKRCAAAS